MAATPEYKQSPQGKNDRTPEGQVQQSPEFKATPEYASTPDGKQMSTPVYMASPEYKGSPRADASTPEGQYIQTPDYLSTPQGKRDQSPEGQNQRTPEYKATPVYAATPDGKDHSTPVFHLSTSRVHRARMTAHLRVRCSSPLSSRPHLSMHPHLTGSR
eukprot:TRINITY_DN559_c0_g1_i7.p3 TRINITY_DN559_c0_g1~~TRINITY_DN559_c0_g1_i7.p3  ORF type:complete len:159 (+),score=18.25 TRINITY_DN559_c0_g1_i7:1485-1961(+)